MSRDRVTGPTLTEPREPWQSDAPPELGLQGQQLGRYEVRQRLGAGGMGEVYEAFDPRLDRLIALKVVLAQRERPVDQVRLLREAKVLARLAHPNIVAVFDADLDNDRLFIAMELIRGASLRDWIRETARPLRERISVLRDVADGLAAAHQVGVIHRDIKPENILVGRDGRARVADFGIARASDDAAVEVETDTISVETPLSRTGAVVGTPHYMAPEHQRQESTGALADQFSFFATAYEVFAGRRLLRGIVDEESYREAPDRVLAARAIPRRLRTVIARGVRPDPGDRYPDMAAAKRALTAAARPRWPRAVAAAAVATAIAGVGVIARGDREAAAPCGGGEDRFATVWSPARQAELTDRFEQLGGADTPALLTYLTRSIDERREHWLGSFVAACEATRVRGEQSEALLDRRMACLDHRLGELDAMLGALAETTTPDALAGVPDAFDRLPAVSSCDDVEVLGRVMPLPAARPVRDRIDDARRRLARVRALHELGRLQEAAPLAAGLAAEAAALGHPPLIAEIALWRSRIAKALGDWDAARAHGDEAARRAVEGGDVLTETEAWISLLQLSSRQGDLRSATVIGQIAETALHRAGTPPDVAARFYSARGAASMRAGEYDDADAAYQRAAALYRDAGGGDSAAYARALVNLASVASLGDQPEVALRWSEQAIASLERALGPEHLDLAFALGPLVYAAMDLGRLDEAERHVERTLAIRQAHLGAQHPDIAFTLAQLATVQGMRGDEVAATTMRDAIAMTQALGEDTTSDVAEMLVTLASIHAMARRPDAAAAVLDEAEATMRAVRDPARSERRDLRILRADIAMQRGRWRDALAACRVLAAELTDVADQPIQQAEAALCLGRSLLATGDAEAARRYVEQALAIAAPTGTTFVTASAHELRARTLDALGLHDDARAAAAAGLATLGDFEGQLAATLRDELARHTAP